MSLYDSIGVDKDGETVSLMDVLEAEETQVLDTIIMEQDVRELYEAYAKCLKDMEEKGSLHAVRALWHKGAHAEGDCSCAWEYRDPMLSRIAKKGD